MFKFILSLISIMAIIVFQIGFLPGLNYSLSFLVNLPLLFVVFISILSSFDRGLATVFLLGLFMDLYSPLFFGFFTIVLLVELILIKIFLFYFLQNKNLAVFLLINLISLIIWYLIYFIIILINIKLSRLPFSNIASGSYFVYPVYQFFIHSLIILILYKIYPSFRIKLAADYVA